MQTREREATDAERAFARAQREAVLAAHVALTRRGDPAAWGAPSAAVVLAAILAWRGLLLLAVLAATELLPNHAVLGVEASGEAVPFVGHDQESADLAAAAEAAVARGYVWSPPDDVSENARIIRREAVPAWLQPA